MSRSLSMIVGEMLFLPRIRLEAVSLLIGTPSAVWIAPWPRMKWAVGTFTSSRFEGTRWKLFHLSPYFYYMSSPIIALWLWWWYIPASSLYLTFLTFKLESFVALLFVKMFSYISDGFRERFMGVYLPTDFGCKLGVGIRSVNPPSTLFIKFDRLMFLIELRFLFSICSCCTGRCDSDCFKLGNKDLLFCFSSRIPFFIRSGSPCRFNSAYCYSLGALRLLGLLNLLCAKLSIRLTYNLFIYF